MENKYCIGFDYDARGRGRLVLYDNNMPELEYTCRTGSIDKAGRLVNAIRPDQWHIIEAPERTEEAGMVITPGAGWKARLWLKLGNSGKYERTHYLIHPDGGKGGTLGCLGIQCDGDDLRRRIGEILQLQKIIPVYVEATRSPSNGETD